MVCYVTIIVTPQNFLAVHQKGAGHHTSITDRSPTKRPVFHSADPTGRDLRANYLSQARSLQAKRLIEILRRIGDSTCLRPQLLKEDVALIHSSLIHKENLQVIGISVEYLTQFFHSLVAKRSTKVAQKYQERPPLQKLIGKSPGLHVHTFYRSVQYVFVYQIHAISYSRRNVEGQILEAAPMVPLQLRAIGSHFAAARLCSFRRCYGCRCWCTGSQQKCNEDRNKVNISHISLPVGLSKTPSFARPNTLH